MVQVVDSLRKAEIGNLDVPLLIDQQILWLQVAVHDAARMQVLQRQHNFGGVEPGNVFFEPDSPPQMAKELAARDIFEHHV